MGIWISKSIDEWLLPNVPQGTPCTSLLLVQLLLTVLGSAGQLLSQSTHPQLTFLPVAFLQQGMSHHKYLSKSSLTPVVFFTSSNWVDVHTEQVLFPLYEVLVLFVEWESQWNSALQRRKAQSPIFVVFLIPQRSLHDQIPSGNLTVRPALLSSSYLFISTK